MNISPRKIALFILLSFVVVLNVIIPMPMGAIVYILEILIAFAYLFCVAVYDEWDMGKW